MTYKDPKVRIAYWNKRKDSIRNWYKHETAGIFCEICGEDERCCLSFHHLDPKKKIRAVSSMVSRAFSKEMIEKEIAKCVVLCENCHRKLHEGLVQLA